MQHFQFYHNVSLTLKGCTLSQHQSQLTSKVYIIQPTLRIYSEKIDVDITIIVPSTCTRVRWHAKDLLNWP